MFIILFPSFESQTIRLFSLRICSDEFFEIELHKINQIAANHQYPTSVIERTKRKAHKTFSCNFIRAKEDHDNILVLSHCKNVSPLVSIF